MHWEQERYLEELLTLATLIWGSCKIKKHLFLPKAQLGLQTIKFGRCSYKFHIAGEKWDVKVCIIINSKSNNLSLIPFSFVNLKARCVTCMSLFYGWGEWSIGKGPDLLLVKLCWCKDCTQAHSPGWEWPRCGNGCLLQAVFAHQQQKFRFNLKCDSSARTAGSYHSKAGWKDALLSKEEEEGEHRRASERTAMVQCNLESSCLKTTV